MSIFIWFHVQDEKEFREIIEAVKGSENEKRLASQFIGKFFKFFPKLADDVINAFIDLCKDENIEIRREAVRDLPLLCKDTMEHIPKIGKMLAKLLVVDDQQDLQQVYMSLQQIFKFDPKAALDGIVSRLLCFWCVNIHFYSHVYFSFAKFCLAMKSPEFVS